MRDLYDLPNGWEFKRLDEVSTFFNGRAYKKKELLDDGKYRVLRVGNFFTNNNWYYSDLELDENKYCDNGDLLYAWSASFGPKIWDGEKVIYHYHIWKVVPKENYILRDYLFQYLNWDTEKIKSDKGSGTTMVHITKGSMEERIIPLPPLSEQQRIVSKLDNLFEKIDRSIALHQKNMDEADLFMGSVLNDVFGELEEKYEKKQLKDIVDNFDGKRIPIKSSDRESMSGEYPYYGASGIIDYVNDYIFDGEYLLISEDGANLTVRKYPIAFIANGKFWVNNHAHIVSAKEKISTNKYMEYIFAYTDISGFITGSAQPKMSQGKMNLIEFVIPPLNIQQKVVKYLDEVSEKIEKVKQVQKEKMDSLKALKASILDSAFRGGLL